MTTPVRIGRQFQCRAPGSRIWANHRRIACAASVLFSIFQWVSGQGRYLCSKPLARGAGCSRMTLARSLQQLLGVAAWM